jgi:hypothetical protein
MNPNDKIPGIGGQVPLIGRQQVQIMVSNLCVNCFPKPVPAVSIWYGLSLCEKCLTPRRKSCDMPHRDSVTYDTCPGILRRDYRETWGKSPEEAESENE